METIRILVVDDHPLVRNGIKMALEKAQDIEVVGEAGDSSSALEQAAILSPDMVLLDMLMPGSSGAVVVHRLKEAHPKLKIIILTAFEDEKYLFGALGAGADAYILKSIPPENLASVIQRVWRGEPFLSAELLGQVMGKFHSISGELAKHELGISDFELQVLHLMAKGAKNKQIAAALFTSETTVKRKVQDICQKLEAADRVQAVAEAINRGLI
jgi:two-component system, NarL family, response regulator DevR